MDTNTVLIIVVQVAASAGTIATLKNDINWLKAIINKLENRVELLESKLC